MKITERKIGELIPYENNPRYNDEAVEYVAKSIKEFGFNVPIVIDKDNVIVAGNTRLRAAEKLGLEKVPCVTVNNLTDEQIKAYRLIDNKTAEMSEWDYDLLEMELEAIDIDMSEYGLYCHEEYPEETEEVEVEQEDGTKIKECKVIREASEHYSLRYTETLVVECAYLRREVKRLSERLEKLEK